MCLNVCECVCVLPCVCLCFFAMCACVCVCVFAMFVCVCFRVYMCRMIFLFGVVIWLFLSVFLCVNVLRAYRMTKIGASMVRNGTAKPDWIPFIRIDHLPNMCVLILRSFLIGPFVMIMSMVTVTLTGLLCAVLPARWMPLIIAYGCRGLCFWLGISIVQKGIRDSRANCIVANHNSAIDIFVIAAVQPCSFVAMHSVQDLYLIGRMAKALDCIFVARDSIESRSAAKLAITQKLLQKNTSPLVIFPEGSTNNGAYILQFRRGAFETANVAVQPVRIEFEDFNLNFTIVTLIQLLSLVCVLPKRQVTLHWRPIIEGTEPAEVKAQIARDAIASVVSAYGHPPVVQANNVSHRDAILASSYYQSYGIDSKSD